MSVMFLWRAPWSAHRRLHTAATQLAALKRTTAAAGGVAGLGKGKKKLGNLGAMEKLELPVESDPERLVNRLCGSNITLDGEDVTLGADSEYPPWLWSVSPTPPPLTSLDPGSKQYWLRVRAAGMKRNNKLKSMRKF